MVAMIKKAVKNFILIFLALAYWELLLASFSGSGTIAPAAVFFFAAVAMAFAALSSWKDGSVEAVLFTLFMFVLLVFYLIQAVYFCQFGSFAPVSMIGVGGDAVAGFGSEMMDTIRTYIARILLCIAPFAAVLVLRFTGKRASEHGGKYHLLRLCMLIMAAFLWFDGAVMLPTWGTGPFTAYDAYHNPNTATDISAARIGVLPTSLIETKALLFGADTPAEVLPVAQEEEEEVIVEEPVEDEIDRSPNVIKAIDFKKLSEAAGDDEAVKALCDYYSAAKGTNKNEYTGLCEGYNLIYICAESFDDIALDEELTPTLCRMAKSGVVLNNYYNSFKNTTTNGEYTFLTGIWPDFSRQTDAGRTEGTFYATRKNFMPYAPGNALGALGVPGYFYHGYWGWYYGRNETHPNLGYQCRFNGDQLAFQTDRPTSDYELFEQSLPEFIDLDRFNVYYMTFSGHGNYNGTNPMVQRNYGHVEEVLADKGYSYEAKSYLAANYELEKAMTYLLEELDRAGKLDNTLIVLAGDHYPYAMTDQAYNELAGEKQEGFDRYKSTCIIWSASIEKPIVCDSYCCNVDILPTVYNLLGLEYDSRMLSGVDVLSDAPHTAVLYNKSFINEYCSFDTANMRTTGDEEMIASISQKIDSSYSVAMQIVKTDFYDFVWTNSGLKAPEE